MRVFAPSEHSYRKHCQVTPLPAVNEQGLRVKDLGWRVWGLRVQDLGSSGAESGHGLKRLLKTLHNPSLHFVSHLLVQLIPHSGGNITLNPKP